MKKDNGAEKSSQEDVSSGELSVSVNAEQKMGVHPANGKDPDYVDYHFPKDN